MATRSEEMTLTFSKAFTLSEVDRPLPAGTYRVVVVEEDIAGLSFLAFRRIATMLHLPALDERRIYARVGWRPGPRWSAGHRPGSISPDRA